MNTKQILFALAFVAIAPIATQASAAYKQKFGEAYNLDTPELQSTLTRADLREEVLSLDRKGQQFGEAFPYEQKDPMTMRLLAEVRREARNQQRMYGEVSGERGHN